MQGPLSGHVIDPEPLKAYCREVAFPSGAVLRTKGLLSIDMYLLTDGEVEVSVDTNGPSGAIAAAGRGAPIGEIGFLTGVPATATVTLSGQASAGGAGVGVPAPGVGVGFGFQFGSSPAPFGANGNARIGFTAPPWSWATTQPPPSGAAEIWLS